jgi:hypothetical protein
LALATKLVLYALATISFTDNEGRVIAHGC